MNDDIKRIRDVVSEFDNMWRVNWVICSMARIHPQKMLGRSVGWGLSLLSKRIST